MQPVRLLPDENHVHLHLDPKGFDISKFMHSLNTAYVWYYNTKYSRHGHLFQDRFVSKILSTDAYNLVVSAYIHNNPHDIKGYSGREEMYRYSSYGVYLGICRDQYGIVDTNFIKSLFDLPKMSVSQSVIIVLSGRRAIAEKGQIFDIDETHLIFPCPLNMNMWAAEISYQDRPITNVISFISDRLHMNQLTSLHTKCRHKLTNYRAFTAYVLRVLCNLSYKDICRHIFNITITSCSRLCKKGYDLIHNDSLHMQIFTELALNSAWVFNIIRISNITINRKAAQISCYYFCNNISCWVYKTSCWIVYCVALSLKLLSL